MGQAAKQEERELPQQNTALIGVICVCQMVLVLSIVAFLYLSVAIYMPSKRAFNAGFDLDPVTCTTIHNVNNCSWTSCGEWCLTKATGHCPQLHVSVRQNGTDMILENCQRISSNTCAQVIPEAMKRYNCNNGTVCSALTGVFNCTNGHCGNMSDVYNCHHKADGMIIDSEKDNAKLNGFFDCKNSRCQKIKKAFICDRYCPKITTIGVNTYIMYDDSLYTGDCQRALAVTEANGTSPGRPIPPTEIWSEEKSKKMLIASCQRVERTADNNLKAFECINGTVIDESEIPTPFINFTTFWSLVDKSKHPVDNESRYLPPEQSLIIYNTSRLYINLEGCVNTLKGECKEFDRVYGRDGRNHTAQARFPCFHNPDSSFMALLRFDLEKVWTEFLVALIIPSVLFVISFTALIIITRAVKVGDDAVLRCSLFSSDKAYHQPVETSADKSIDNNCGTPL